MQWIDFHIGGCPAIKKHPADKKGARGESVIFECQATGATPLLYTWLHEGVVIPAKNQRSLEINVRRDSKGKYSCRVQNDFGSTTSNSATLSVGKCIRIVINVWHNIK